jgi:hypothetical protein
MAVAIVTPADGPSFGIAPDGTWTCISAFLKKSGSIPCVRPQPRQGRAHRFLHHLAELTGQRESPVAGHAGCLDEEHLAARRRPGEADGDTRILGALLHLLVEEPWRAQHLDDDFGRHGDRRFVALGAATRRFPAERADFALEVTVAGLARVASNHLPQRIRRELDELRREAVVLDLLLDEVIGGDRQLLFLGVAGDLQHFHAVLQRRRHRVEDVRRGDEEDLGQIERHVEVVVAEGVVLLRVEHLEQRR